MESVGLKLFPVQMTRPIPYPRKKTFSPLPIPFIFTPEDGNIPQNKFYVLNLVLTRKNMYYFEHKLRDYGC